MSFGNGWRPGMGTGAGGGATSTSSNNAVNTGNPWMLQGSKPGEVDPPGAGTNDWWANVAPGLGDLEARVKSIESSFAPGGKIGGFTAPTAWNPFATSVGEVNPMIGDIGKFKAPDLTNLLRQAKSVQSSLNQAKGSFQALAGQGEGEGLAGISPLTIDQMLPFTTADISAALQGRVTPLGVEDVLAEGVGDQVQAAVQPRQLDITDFLGSQDAQGALQQQVMQAVRPDQFALKDFLGEAQNQETLKRNIMEAVSPDQLKMEDFLGAHPTQRENLRRAIRDEVLPTGGFGVSDFIGDQEALRGLIREAATPTTGLGVDDLIHDQGILQMLIRQAATPTTPLGVDDFIGDPESLQGAIREAVRPDAFGMEDFVGAHQKERDDLRQQIMGAVAPSKLTLTDFLGEAQGQETLRQNIMKAIAPDQLGVGDFIGDQEALRRDVRTAATPTTPLGVDDLIGGAYEQGALRELIRSPATPTTPLGVGDLIGGEYEQGVLRDLIRSAATPTTGLGVGDFIGDQDALREQIGAAVQPGKLGISDFLEDPEALRGDIRGAVSPDQLGLTDFLGSPDRQAALRGDIRGAVSPGRLGIGDFLGSEYDRGVLGDQIRDAVSPDRLDITDFLGEEQGQEALRQQIMGAVSPDRLGVSDFIEDPDTLRSGIRAAAKPSAFGVQDLIGGEYEQGVLKDQIADIARLGYDDIVPEGVLDPLTTEVDALRDRLSDYGVGVGGADLDFSGVGQELQDFFGANMENIPVTEQTDLDPIVEAITALSSGPAGSAKAATAAGGTGEEGEAREPTDTGTYYAELQEYLREILDQGGTADELLANDPILQSILADMESERGDRRAQEMEDLKRLGVIRSGDTVRALQKLGEGDERGRMAAIAQAAGRVSGEKSEAMNQAQNLANLLLKRDLGIGELTGEIGGVATLAGRASDLDLIGATIAALEAGTGGEYDELASALLSNLSFYPESQDRDMGAGITHSTNLRDLIRDSLGPDGASGFDALDALQNPTFSEEEQAEIDEIMNRWGRVPSMYAEGGASPDLADEERLAAERLQAIILDATTRALTAGSQVSGADPVTDYGASQNIIVEDREATLSQLQEMDLLQLNKMLKELQDLGYRIHEDAPQDSSDDGVWLHQTLTDLIYKANYAIDNPEAR